MRSLAVFAVGLCVLASGAGAQQVPNPDADVTVTRPAWATSTGPRLAIDGGHHNFHTLAGGYQVFGRLAANDGYRVSAITVPFTAESLADVDVLVIANALDARNVDDWSLPTPSAFTPEEIAAVHAWVEAGGALLLIADHMPMAGAAHDLGASFGVDWINGFALKTPQGPERFDAGHGLADSPVARGTRDDPAVTDVRLFTGSAFRAPGFEPVLVLDDSYRIKTPAVAWQFGDEPGAPGQGLLAGAIRTVGRGRVAVMGEAAMFTGQVTGPRRQPMGIGAPGAEQNPRFALNLLHWLSRRSGY